MSPALLFVFMTGFNSLHLHVLLHMSFYFFVLELANTFCNTLQKNETRGMVPGKKQSGNVEGGAGRPHTSLCLFFIFIF